MHSVIRTPGTSPYSKAREALLRHFGRTPRQLARQLLGTKTLGDKLPSELLDHCLALPPDVKVLFEVIVLDALPANARVAALQHSDVFSMARAADAVVLENRALAESDRVTSSVSALNLSVCDEFDPLGPASLPRDDFAPPQRDPLAAAVSRPASWRRSGPPQAAPSSDGLCSNHARWGRDTYKCLKPTSCKMRTVLAQRPPAPAPAPGNGRAGGRS